LELESTLKAGIYNNNALNSISYRTNLFGINESSGMVRDCTSFVGELNLNLTYSLTRELSIRGGYQLIWIDGVALASEQPSLNSGNFLTPVSAVDTNNSLFYHGALAGLEWVW
jgi:hypothetical protein